MLRLRRHQITHTRILPALFAVLACAGGLPAGEQVPANWSTTPTDRIALRSLQERSPAPTEKARPAVVAVKVAATALSPPETEGPRALEPYASGVIIRADGLILSQAHVSHNLDWRRVRSRKPGERTTVVLCDGRKIEAELLGANQSFDLSLLRLLEPGPFPCVPLVPSATVTLGDWVLKLGHPLGYRRDRPPVVRLGRVLFKSGELFVSDCLITRGDSGGPFLDLDGRLVGILGARAVPAKLEGSLDKPPLVSSDRIEHSDPWSTTTTQFIQQHLDGMLHREITRYDPAAAAKLYESYLRTGDEILPRDQWSQGRAVGKAFEEIVRDSRRVVVSILDAADRQLAYGTIVGADGWVVTMASMLPAEPRCRMPDARVVSAQLVGIDPAFDLALLKVPLMGLNVLESAQKSSAIAGTLVVSVGMSEIPLAIGVVSVPRRDLPGPFPTRVTRPASC